MVRAEQGNRAKRGRKDAKRQGMEKKGEDWREERLAVESRAERTGIVCQCVYVCACVSDGNKRFLARHKKQIPRSRRVIYESPLGLECINTSAQIYMSTHKDTDTYCTSHANKVFFFLVCELTRGCVILAHNMLIYP